MQLFDIPLDPPLINHVVYSKITFSFLDSPCRENECSTHAICLNETNFLMCRCIEGFSGDGIICIGE